MPEPGKSMMHRLLAMASFGGFMASGFGVQARRDTVVSPKRVDAIAKATSKHLATKGLKPRVAVRQPERYMHAPARRAYLAKLADLKARGHGEAEARAMIERGEA